MQNHVNLIHRILYFGMALILFTGCTKSTPPPSSTNFPGSSGGGTTGGGNTGGSSSSDCSRYWVCLNIPRASVTYTSIPNFFQAYGAAVSSLGRVYFAGGHDDFWSYGGSLNEGVFYDQATQSFNSFSLSCERSFLAGAKAGNKILFAGGKEVSYYSNQSPNSYSNCVDIFDEQSMQRTHDTLSESRAHLCSVSAGNLAFFIGGRTFNGYSNRMDVYNSTTNSWQVIMIPRERAYAGAVIINGKIYIAGGMNSSGWIKRVDIYDIQSGQWSFLDSPNEHPFASVTAVNSKLIIAGGDGANRRATDIYNTITGVWSTVNLSSSRFNITVASVNNKVVFLGGSNYFSGSMFSLESSNVDIYDDITGEWYPGTVSPGVNGVMAASTGTHIILLGFMYANATTITNTAMIIDP